MAWSNVAKLEVETYAAILSGPSAINPSASTVDLQITSTATIGTLYVAGRSSGAYLPGQEQQVKDDALTPPAGGWGNGGDGTPNAGVNNYQATGLNDDTLYHFGFVQEA